MTNSIFTVRAPAKLTWSLAITGCRDDGYHLLDAEMITLDLYDIIHIEPNQTGLLVDGPFCSGVPIDARNLVHQALRFVGREARITVTKNIPHGGGLGGGSANAAAVLRWAGLTGPDDIQRSATIGADVPFCVVGGRARVSGIGEIVEPLPFLDRQVTLIIPPLPVSTSSVYRAWDALYDYGRAKRPLLAVGTVNELESAALIVEPALALWRDRVREVCGIAPRLAGSGATWFVPGSHGYLAAALSDAYVIEARAIHAEGTTQRT